MILECPECHNRYLIPDRAVGPNGRTVRCASCGHGWFQEGTIAAAGPLIAEPDLSEAAEPAPPPPEGSPEPPPKTAPAIEPLSESENDVALVRAPTQSPLRPLSPPTRGGGRRWVATAVVAALLLVAGAAIILWATAPGAFQRLATQLGAPIGVLAGPGQSPLRLVDNPIERRDLSNGSELFAVSGKVFNPSGVSQRVPNIRADLRDASGRIVFSWTITPEQRTLAPGNAIDFNSAKLDVPPTSKRLELSFAGEAGG